jgi:hypothetical protein
MYYDYETRTLDLTTVKMSQTPNIRVRNERAIEYSSRCEHNRNKRKELIKEMILNIVISITLVFCFCCIYIGMIA